MNFELELPRELDSAAAARQAIGELANRLPEDVVGDVRLLVSELVTNALRHAELSASDHITLAVQVTPETVRVEVTDPGTGFDPGDTPTDPRDADGWGLYLVSTLSDAWGVEIDGGETLVWFELRRAA